MGTNVIVVIRTCQDKPLIRKCKVPDVMLQSRHKTKKIFYTGLILFHRTFFRLRALVFFRGPFSTVNRSQRLQYVLFYHYGRPATAARGTWLQAPAAQQEQRGRSQAACAAGRSAAGAAEARARASRRRKEAASASHDQTRRYLLPRSSSG